MSDELESLPEIPDLHELSESAPTRPMGAPAGERPPLRVLDKAPQHLRLAALIVVAGSLLPWMPGEGQGEPGTAWMMTLLAKAIMGAAAWAWLQQVYHDFGPKLTGVLAQLANLQLKPKPKADEADKQRRARAKANPTQLVHPFPTGLHLLALLLAVAAVLVAANDPRKGLIGSNGIPEVIMLGWAAFTWVHIANYERWGGFNPLFPLMFLGMLFAGLMAVIAALGGEATGMTKLASLLGGAAVAGGGGLAAYTIAEAMMAAKKEGDRKKAEALEARKAARKKDK
jgi:hypothetical protein